MKKNAIAIAIAASTLLLTGCGASAPAASDGVATSTQSPTAVTSEAPQPIQTSSSSSVTTMPEANASTTPIAANVTGKPGVATDEQMVVIDKVARAIANENYNDASVAGYFVFDSHGAPSADAAIMASKRAEHADYFDKVKAAYASGNCKLVPVSINSSGVIYANMTCNDGSAPIVSIHASFMGSLLNYIDALYVE